ncbi:hypothetical protein SPI_09327 [Niveomyces insectorum RCEF 264]|uniref:Mei5 protein n=1 Tax=Niveomyces insectorum RCEF 264 TaxID=1081102 RepID=A0A162MB42_9HYPO|nr:hypothetical protein SPI_09327 [Niveomyces insectorum RCEF 264]
MAVEAESKDATQVVDGLVGAIKAISADSNYNLLASIFQEVMLLRAKNAELITANRNVFEQYWEFRRDLEDAQAKLESAKAALDAELAGKVQELADMTDARDKLDTALSATKDDLAATTGAKEQLEADLSTANGELDSLRALKQSLEDELSQVTAQLEEQKHLSDAAAQKNAELQMSLTQREAELESTKADLTTTEGRLQEIIREKEGLKETLCHLQTDLANKSSRLNELDSYRIVLKEDPEDVYVKILDTIWTKLFDLVVAHFRQDLEDKVLHDPSCWNNLRNTDALKGPTQIPLPQTNSQVAKAMRIASVLSVLSRTLHKHIFRPVYLIDDDSELTRLLHSVECDNPTKEEHMRSTLLATLPEMQRASAKVRVRQVVREVSWVVQHLLGALPFDAFCAGLSDVCVLACTEWQKIQRAKLKIEPYFGPPYDEFEWQALPLPEFRGRRGLSNSSSTSSSSSSTTRAGSPAPASETQPATSTEEDKTAETTTTTGETGQTEEETATATEAVTEEGTAADAGGAAELPAEEVATPAEGAGDAEADASGAAAAAAAADAETAVADDDDDEGGNSTAAARGRATGTATLTTTGTTDDSDDDDDDASDMDPSDILFVVWPSMTTVENGEQQPITQGLVVTKDQAARAFQEMYTARNGSRSNTKRARTMSFPSMPHPTISAGGGVGVGSAKPGKPFLGVGGGEELSVVG